MIVINKVRFCYTKTGKAKYISHLDLTAVMQRSLLRAGVNLKYSEGFNPHPYMSVALPLSVGCESSCELIDISIEDGKIPDLRSIKLPEGLFITEAYNPVRKFNDISWVEIEAEAFFDNKPDDEAIKKIQAVFNRESIIISKRTKRGSNDIDVALYIKDMILNFGNNILMNAKISAQNPTINADDIQNIFGVVIKPDYFTIKRIEIYDKNMVKFR